MERASRRPHGPICGPGSDTGADLVINHWALERCCERFSVGFILQLKKWKKRERRKGRQGRRKARRIWWSWGLLQIRECNVFSNPLAERTPLSTDRKLRCPEEAGRPVMNDVDPPHWSLTSKTQSLCPGRHSVLLERRWPRGECAPPVRGQLPLTPESEDTLQTLPQPFELS